MKRSTTRAIAASAFTAGAIFTAGAALLPAPLFYVSGTTAAICAIVAVAVLVMGELRGRDSRAPAHDDHHHGELTTADVCRVLGVDIPPPRYDPDDVAFARRLGLPAYGVGRALETGTGVMRVIRLADGGVGLEAVEVESTLIGIDYGTGDRTVTTEVKVAETARESEVPGTTPLPSRPESTQEARIRPFNVVEATRERLREDYWEKRAEALLEFGDPATVGMFEEVLGNRYPDPTPLRDRAVALLEEVKHGDPNPSLPLLAYSERQPAAVTADSALAVIEAHRRHAAGRAEAALVLVDELAAEVIRLRGVVIGQVGMAAAGQARANEETIDIDEAPVLVTATDEDLMAEAFRRGLVVHAPV